MAHPVESRFNVLFACGREPDYVRNQMLQRALARQHRIIAATDPSRPAALRYLKVLGQAVYHLRCAPDVVLVGFYGQPLMPAMRALTRRPIVFDAYVSTYDTLCFDRRWFRPRSIPGRLAYALDLWSCHCADRILLDTRTHRDYFVHTFGLPPGKLAVVYVGCDETHFVPRSPPVSSQSFEVFTYTSFLRLHGVEYILQAAKQLEGYRDVALTIAGAGPRLAQMQSLARDLELQNVRFPGWVAFDQLPDCIAGADLCLGGHFSDVPKAGRVIATKTFQFLAMGKPTIAGDNPANREVMTHGQDAYLCPVADPAALAAAILELRDDLPLRRQLGENGLILYRRRFTTAAIASALQAVLDDLLV